MSETIDRNRRPLLAATALLLVLIGTTALFGMPHLIWGSNPNNPSVPGADNPTYGGLIAAVEQVTKIALVVDVVITPLACTIGAIGLAIGNRRGTTIIVSSLAVLAFIGSVTGIVN